MSVNALTFNLLAAVEAFPSAGCWLEDFPLKGGMAWINIFGRLIEGSGLEGFTWNGGMVWMIIFCHLIGAFGLVADSMGVGRTTFPKSSRGLPDACSMARAFSETASDLAFSRICSCFSSSLVKIGTRSSGMGFLSCDRRFDQCDLIPVVMRNRP